MLEYRRFKRCKHYSPGRKKVFKYMLNNNGPRADPCGTTWSNSYRYYLFILFSLHFTLNFNNFYKMQSQLTSYAKTITWNIRTQSNSFGMY